MKIKKDPWLIFSISCLPIAAIFFVLFFIELTSQVNETEDSATDSSKVSYHETEWITVDAGPYTFGNPAIVLHSIDYAYEIMKYEV